MADGLAERQVRFPEVPIVFTETRSLAEEWTYRYLAAAHGFVTDEPAAGVRIGGSLALPGLGDRLDPTTAEVRAWARANGFAVSDRGRIPARLLEAFRTAESGSPEPTTP